MKQTTVLFLVKDQDILLAMKKRGFGQGRYNGVGGKIEANETVEQAVVRECQEEIGVTPTSFRKMAQMVFDEQHNGAREVLEVHAFICDAWRGIPVETEEMAPEWFRLNHIPYQQMWDDDPYWLPQILEGKLLKARFTLDSQDKVIKKSVQEVTSL